MTSLYCWCENTRLEEFSSDYMRCPECNTLIYAGTLDPDISKVTDDSKSFYGKEYWLSHQVDDYNHPDIIARAREDLKERCLYWLQAVLKYKLPPGDTLELGSAHGGFVALMRQAGFNAVGLELSPWIVRYAQRTFQIPVLEGVVEDQEIEPNSLDMILMMDVLEHFPDPVSSINHCLRLLKPEGILVIQTPRYPEDASYDQLKATEDIFLKHLKPVDHIFIFSHQSIKKFFTHLDVPHLAFEPALFSDYDMFLFASRKPLQVYAPELIDETLLSSPGGRIVLALLDQSKIIHQLNQHLNEVESDRAARLELIHKLTEQLEIVEADRAARLDVINRLDAQVQELSKRLGDK
jgi:2-polyprenyl-3-methyl-5-hydroxy-6-metoxy-1,4-benzoquinol methylase